LKIAPSRLHILLGTFVAIVGCASAPPPATLGPESLRLSIYIAPTCADACVAEVALLNVATRPVAVSLTHGPTGSPWLFLHLDSLDQQGGYIYPGDIDLFFDRVDYKCLKAGEELRWKVDLLNWYVELGGRRSGSVVEGSLFPGRYRVRAEYSDSPHRASGACARFEGKVLSEWRGFEYVGE